MVVALAKPLDVRDPVSSDVLYPQTAHFIEPGLRDKLAFATPNIRHEEAITESVVRFLAL